MYLNKDLNLLFFYTYSYYNYDILLLGIKKYYTYILKFIINIKKNLLQ